jgi:hypothetical protein
MLAKLFAMMQGELTQNFFTFGSQGEQDLAAIFSTTLAADITSAGEPVHQFDCAVMLDEKPRCNFTDGGLYTVGQAMHCKQQLMLLRLDAVFARGRLAEMKKLADLPPKLGQITILVLEKIMFSAHIYIVSRYKKCRNQRSDASRLCGSNPAGLSVAEDPTRRRIFR